MVMKETSMGEKHQQGLFTEVENAYIEGPEP